VFGALIPVLFLGWLFGLGYILSSIIQECCILLAGVLLISVSGVLIGALVTAFIYALVHPMKNSNWHWKFSLLFLWGIVSILLYIWLHQPLLNIAIHAAAGSVLIYIGLLYKD
jgi:hypothetical protein